MVYELFQQIWQVHVLQDIMVKFSIWSGNVKYMYNKPNVNTANFDQIYQSYATQLFHFKHWSNKWTKTGTDNIILDNKSIYQNNVI
jgi:hypothetical protein